MNTATDAAQARQLPRPWRAALAFGPVALVAVSGAFATRPSIPVWYERLAKPPFTPPNALFAPAWTLLYASMAYAAYRIMARSPATPGRSAALRMFYVQLALNAAWSWLFFGAQNPALGAVNILVLLLAILATIHRFRRLDRIAGGLLVPYALWVGYATYLNLGIWRLNG